MSDGKVLRWIERLTDAQVLALRDRVVNVAPARPAQLRAVLRAFAIRLPVGEPDASGKPRALRRRD